VHPFLRLSRQVPFVLLVVVTLVLVKSLEMSAIGTDLRLVESGSLCWRRGRMMKDNDRVGKGSKDGPDYRNLHEAFYRHLT
jgi:hypothetical protein